MNITRRFCFQPPKKKGKGKGAGMSKIKNVKRGIFMSKLVIKILD